jgi:EmrB/QacA subfamily drug resistance transporter
MRGNTVTTTSTGPAPLSPGRTRAVLAVVAVALMTVVSAVSGLNVALPDLARETGASQTQLTWVVDAYTVVFAGLLLFAGALGDRFGRKHLLTAGLVVFGAAALAGSFTDDPTTLIAVRAVMGLGAAGIMPTTLSVITTSFGPRERPKAVGVWVGVAGGGAVLGLFATGLLLEWFAWNSFFVLNVALAAVALVGTLAIVPNSVDPEADRLDVVGALLSLVAVSGVVLGIIEGPERGWSDPLTLGALVTGLAAAVAFLAWELRHPHPLLDPRLFRLRGFSAGSLTIAVQFFASFGLFFTILQYLQFVVGKSPLMAAVALLPLPIVMIPLARNAPRVAARVGFRRVAPVGLLLTAAGLAVLSTMGTDFEYGWFAVGLVVFAMGMALAGTPSTTAITESLPDAKQGVASAVNDTARELGSALGIAILGSALNQAYRDGMASVVGSLPEQARDAALSSIAFVSSPQVTAAGEAARPVVEGARAAFVDGVGVALLTASVTAALAAVAVFLLAPARIGTTRVARSGAGAQVVPADADLEGQLAQERQGEADDRARVTLDPGDERPTQPVDREGARHA